MPRRPRNEQADATYHVLARGVNRARIFVDDEDYRTFTRLLAVAVQRQGWHLLCYCLMPNHVHLLVETPSTNLGNGMQWALGRYALAFNERHGRVGHLFQDRYKSPHVRSDEAFVRVIPYIALNPVAAQLCREPAEWRWASHAAVARSSPPRWLAHERLQDRLESITAARCYEQLIETWSRERYRRNPPNGV